MKECSICGKEINSFKLIDSEAVCDTCIHKYYVLCECEQWVPRQYYYQETKDCWYCANSNRGF